MGPMIAYEIISVFIDILTLLFTFGGFIVACLSFLSRNNDTIKQNIDSVLWQAKQPEREKETEMDS